eukprot:TRINITY_DN5300_c0_g1_i4.p1 TRINITY_DN5300_c0_g1~~TRINITY_DN5300_c0_g1_i4.p1  ORF type:complete len:492 (+),score=123.09 TRINITY_DN5300_c0_g1_i4:35-1510(+)
MFEFDFDELGPGAEDSSEKKQSSTPSSAGNGPRAAKRSGQTFSNLLANGKTANKTTYPKAPLATPTSFATSALDALVAAEDVRAAAMLAKLAPSPVSGYSTKTAAPPTASSSAETHLSQSHHGHSQVRPSKQYGIPEKSRGLHNEQHLHQFEQKQQQYQEMAVQERFQQHSDRLAGGLRAIEERAELSEEAKRAAKEEADERAAAEAAVERAIERDRQSKWWQKFEESEQFSSEKHLDIVFQPKPNFQNPNPLKLPTRGFKVVAKAVTLRSDPSLGSPVCGGKQQGDIVRAIEETFDGWIKLADGAHGWAFRAPLSEDDESAELRALESPKALAVEKLAQMPGRQMLEVVAATGIAIRREPFSDALLLETRSVGEFLLAETQTYHGWVRLSDNTGWAQALSPDGDRFLLCVRPEELQLSVPGSDAKALQPSPELEEMAAIAREEATRKEALRQLEAAAQGGNTALFRAALEVARQKGVSKRDLARANAMRQ